MNLLTIDTSTHACSVAVTVDEQLIAEHLVNLSGHQSSRIIEAVDVVLRGAAMTVDDLDCFGVALGPGSFTGLRVGIATAKGLALAVKKPVVGFSSLAMLALNVPCADTPVCPMFDARKKEVYVGLYGWKGGLVPIVDDCVMPPLRFLEALDGPAIFLGDGAVTYRELIEEQFGEKAVFAPFPCHQPSAARGAFLARQAFSRGELVSLHDLSPRYIRPSEAEVAKMLKEQL